MNLMQIDVFADFLVPLEHGDFRIDAEYLIREKHMRTQKTFSLPSRQCRVTGAEITAAVKL